MAMVASARYLPQSFTTRLEVTTMQRTLQRQCTMACSTSDVCSEMRRAKKRSTRTSRSGLSNWVH